MSWRKKANSSTRGGFQKNDEDDNDDHLRNAHTSGDGEKAGNESIKGDSGSINPRLNQTKFGPRPPTGALWARVETKHRIKSHPIIHCPTSEGVSEMSERAKK